MPAAYLVGYLCGLRAKKGKVSDCIFDAGLYASIRGTRIYSALKGAIDAGLKVPCSKEALPSEDRVSGKHIESYAGKMKKEHPDAYKRQFSAYAKSKTEPESLSKHFSEVKAKLKA
jgi:large subunit ribosomal protein L18